MNKRLSIRALVISSVLIINLLIVSCGVGQVVQPTPTSTATSTPVPPTLTATSSPTPTPSSPEFISLLSWVSKVEVDISEFRTFEDGLSNPILMREFENLRGLFPESKGNLVIMTERGDVGVINNKTGLIMFGQTITGENGSSYTFLVTKDYSDTLNESVFQPNVDGYIIYPDLVDNEKKEEILRILGTLADVWEGKITENADLANHTPSNPMSFTQIFGRVEEFKNGKLIKEFLRVETSSEENIFNNYDGFGDDIWPKYVNSSVNGRPIMSSRVVKRDTGSYVSAYYSNFFVNWNFKDDFINYIPSLAGRVILEPYDNLMREIFYKYYVPKHKSSRPFDPVGNWENYSLEEYYKHYPLGHVYDNYPPEHQRTSAYQEMRSQGLPPAEVDYYNHYVSQVIVVNISSLVQPP